MKKKFRVVISKLLNTLISLENSTDGALVREEQYVKVVTFFSLALLDKKNPFSTQTEHYGANIQF